MKEAKEAKEKKMTLQDVINETSKPIMVPIPSAGGVIPYIRPTSAEVKQLQERVDNESVLLRERDRLNCYDSNGKPINGAVPIPEKEIKDKMSIILSDLMLWKGFNKADSSVTEKLMQDLSSGVKSQMNLYIAKLDFSDILSDEELGGLKNLLELTKD